MLYYPVTDNFQYQELITGPAIECFVFAGKAPFSASMTLHSEDEVHCMVSITFNAATFDDIVEQTNHLPVQYAVYHPSLVTDRSVPNLPHPLIANI